MRLACSVSALCYSHPTSYSNSSSESHRPLSQQYKRFPFYKGWNVTISTLVSFEFCSNILTLLSTGFFTNYDSEIANKRFSIDSLISVRDKKKLIFSKRREGKRQSERNWVRCRHKSIKYVNRKYVKTRQLLICHQHGLIRKSACENTNQWTINWYRTTFLLQKSIKAVAIVHNHMTTKMN